MSQPCLHEFMVTVSSFVDFWQSDRLFFIQNGYPHYFTKSACFMADSHIKVL